RLLSRREAIGTMVARVDIALAHAGQSARALTRPHQWDLRRAPDVLDALLPFVVDAPLRDRLQSQAAAAWLMVEPLSPDLPRQVIHGDLTDDNIVVLPGHGVVPDGVIDFGDLNHSWTVGELAVTVSSLLHHTGGSVTSVMAAITAYHAVRPLSRAEAEALWPLVVLRGAMLVASGAHVGCTDPDNEYAAGNLGHEMMIFERATALPITVATALVLDTVGAERTNPRLPRFVPLIPTLAASAITTLDFSAASSELGEGRWAEAGVERAITSASLAAGASGTMTVFAQPRLTRATPLSAAEPANCVLGVELAVVEPHEVVAPWSGTVEHTDDGMTLAGAGVRMSLGGVIPRHPSGTEVTAGEPIGRVETALTLRVARDGVEIPWAVTSALVRAWGAVSLDPTALLFSGTEPVTPREDELLDRRERFLAAAQEHYYVDPPMMVRGWREHLVDDNGRVYLDGLNNVTSIGHSHPRLVAALTRQWNLLNTNSRFHYPAVVDFAERLASLLPDGLDSVFFVNSGSEAVDLALRIGRAWTGRRDVLAVREAYHGWTDLSDSVSTSIADNPDALTTRPPWVHTVDAPNSYRGRYRGAEASRYARDAVQQIYTIAEAGSPIGTFIAEAYYGNAGGIALPDGYLHDIYAAVRSGGGLCVADEVQVGYGRLGEWFWGFEQQSVVPDVVAVAKAMGNGHPLGAVITTAEIAEHYRSQGYFFSSAGGSPVSSVIGMTVLDVIRDEELQRNARETGAYLKARLEQLGARHPIVGIVHGSGLYLGLELVRDRGTLEPATEETTAICERLRELGIIMQPTSDRQCVLKIKPPLCFTRQSADFFVNTLDEVLSTGW
ncbi:aminotransferase, partial [Salinibacterium sp.]|uniref:aminotransferase n=1 Tax=Salinibacterium sp. TaxID=1915057 RepID=UPI00286CF9A2